jgi:hypothetical protein
MAKNEKTVNPRVTQIFEDLEDFLEFCRDFGYKYDESELYSNRSFAYRQYQKCLAGKQPKNMWEIDGARLKDRA